MSLQVYDEKSQQAAAEAVTALQNNAPRVERTPYAPSRLDYFAAAALSGICSEGGQSGFTESSLRYNAEFAIGQAKAVLAVIDSPKTE